MTLLHDRQADAEVLFKEAHQRRRRRRILMAAVVAVAVGAAAAGVALAGGSSGPRRPAPSAAPVHPALGKIGPPPRVAWVDYQGRVHIGSLQNHQQRVVASGGEAPVTSKVVSGNTIFWLARGAMGYEVMAYDMQSGQARVFANGTNVFNAIGNSDVFVDDGNNATVARYRLDGHLVKRFALPDGWYLAAVPGPALAHGGILVQSQTSEGESSGAVFKPSTIAIWTPVNGRIHPLGEWSVIATHTSRDGAASDIAWFPQGCSISQFCTLQLTDLATGVTRHIRGPLGFGFTTGAAFSPDGRQLALFADLNPGYNSKIRLALVDVATGSTRLVPDATVGVGEPIAWAQWLPGSKQLIAGGLSGEDGAGTWHANHFLVDSKTLRSTPFHFLTDGQQDVNYSAVVLP